MNPTLRRLITAGLGSLAMTEQAVRRLVKDLVNKGDITRSEGERILADLERRWKKESVRFGENWERGREGIEQMIDGAVTTVLDSLGLVRKSEVGKVKQSPDRRATKKRSPATTTARRRKKDSSAAS